MERARGKRHDAGVDPVGDPDIVLGQQGAHRIAQQRSVMPGERCDQEHLVPLLRGLLEMDQAAERLFLRHFDLDLGQIPLRLFIALGDPQEQIARGGEAARKRPVRERTERMPEPAARPFRHEAQRRERHVLRLVKTVEHRVPELS